MTPERYRAVLQLLSKLADVQYHRVEAAADAAAACNLFHTGDEIEGPWSTTLGGFAAEVAAAPAELRQLLEEVFAAGRAHEAQSAARKDPP